MAYPIHHMTNTNKTNINALKKTADLFFTAFAACNAAKTREEFKAAEPALDKALNDYRKAHGISSAFGLMDCINHYNRTYAQS